jgi:hypothetical protein
MCAREYLVYLMPSLFMGVTISNLSDNVSSWFVYCGVCD